MIVSTVKAILSGEDEFERDTSQTEALGRAHQQLRSSNSPIILELDSGQTIKIGKVLDGGDPSEHSLSVEISG